MIDRHEFDDGGNVRNVNCRSCGQRRRAYVHLRDEVETSSYTDMMRRCIRALGRRIGDGDVEDIGLALALRDELDQAVADGVRRLHEQGESWARIGRGAGITRQGALQRWGS